MTLRRLHVAPLVIASLALGAQRADASTTLGSPDASVNANAFACAACPAGVNMGFEQFALRGATVEAPEDGVLVSATAQARRIAGTEQPRLAVLRPVDGGVGVRVADYAPLPVSAPEPKTVEVADLHLSVRRGDSVGLVLATGQVDLGVRTRPRPDGAVRSFSQPCDPCGVDGGTGVELLFNAVVEPDVDTDGLGDETQDPDGGGLGEDWVDDWFEDYEDGDALDELTDEDEAFPERQRRLGLLAADRRRHGGATLLIRTPKAGRLRTAITLPRDRRTGAGPFVTILTGERRVRRAGLVRLRLDPTPTGARMLAHRPRVRTKALVSLRPKRGPVLVRMRSLRL